MKTILPSLASLVAVAFFFGASPAQAEMKFGFGDVSVNHLDWNRGVEKKSRKRDFQYLEVEGGALFDWGEVYGFFDLENPGKPGGDVRSAGKGTLNYFVGSQGFSVYAHVYNFAMYQFAEQNRVLGAGYTLITPKYWIKPFLGVHDVSQTYYSGSNGYMAGWVVGYFLSVGKQKFLLADWHEHEFGRNVKYAAGNGGKKSAHNGAASVWWIATEHATLGLQWRYATDKLGTGGSLGAFIYSLKYIF